MLSLPVCALSCLFTAIALPALNPLLIANTPSGSFHGEYNSYGVRKWKGIPYAKPPVANLRLAPPQPLENISGIFYANVTAPGCPQNCPRTDGPAVCPVTTSEDCLYLAITAPPKNNTELKAVFIWFHGGTFEIGAGDVPLYDGTAFALNDVITVNVNYRLGALGFLASSTLNGNYGFLDQRMAMQWVQKNIKYFGGDPNRVTIAGQSAGAMSVAAHLASPLSLGLFQSAVMESNPIGAPLYTRSEANITANFLYNAVGCSIGDDACFRSIPYTDIISASEKLPASFLPYTPIVDTDGEIPQQPFVVLQNGQYPAKINVLAGFNQNEGIGFVYGANQNPMNHTGYIRYLQNLLDARLSSAQAQLALEGLLILYPCPTGTDCRVPASQAFTDAAFACPTIDAMRGLHNAHPLSAAELYFFAQPTPNNLLYSYCEGKACHGAELAFVFSTYQLYPNVTQADIALSKSMNAAWSNFTKHGNAGTRVPFVDWLSSNPTSSYPHPCSILDISGLYPKTVSTLSPFTGVSAQPALRPFTAALTPTSIPTTNSHNSNNNSNGISSAALGGAIAAGSVAVIALVAAVFYLIRRTQHMPSQNDVMSNGDLQLQKI